MSIDHDTGIDRGYFVTPNDVSGIQEIAEQVDRYTQGLYYPIYIGEILAQRYHVEHKLGHGSFSVVWMAHDLVTKRHVALKIMVPGDSGEQEYDMQNRIINTVQDTSSLLIYQETFFLRGFIGDHRVLVFPLHGPNIKDYRKRKPAATRVSATLQLLQALRQLHDIGIVHRDLTSFNVLYSLHPPKGFNAGTKYEYLGRPRKMALFPTQWKRGELVMPMQAHDSFHESMVGDKIVLGDFGVAMKADTPVIRKLRSPAVYCAPEVLHGEDPSFASDMWSYMCLFAELYCACPLFSGADNSEVLSFTVDTLGPLPVAWKNLYDGNGPVDATWYDQMRKPELTLALGSKITRLRPDVSPKERELVLSILERGLSYLPENRPSAMQLLEDDLFKTLMATYAFPTPAQPL
ncbi:kinase domain-containing protein [Hypoxylon argillaceum]|nr:kinase domain-containing protein [Hypoxylon argillaceum]